MPDHRHDDAPRTLLAAERHAALLAMLHTSGSLRVTQAAAALDVTPMTVRRDIVALEQAGLLRRVHGGALPLPGAAAAAPGVVTPGTGAAAPEPSAPTSGPAPAPGTEAPGTAAPGTEAPRAEETGPVPALGVMVPTLDYHWPGIVAGIDSAARAAGRDVVLRVSSYAVEDERPTLERIAAGPAVSGLILAPRLDEGRGGEVISWVARSGLPTVLVEREPVTSDPVRLDPDAAGLDTVTTDHTRGVLLAAEHLARLGHRRAALAVTTVSVTSARLAAAWRRAALPLLDASLPEPVTLPDRSSPAFPAAVGNLLTAVRDGGITALLVHSDPEAFAVVQQAQELGLEVPRDLSVIAYDDESAGRFSPPITAVRPPREALGQAAVELVLARATDPARPVRSVIIAPDLVVRATTGPAPTGPAAAGPATTGPATA